MADRPIRFLVLRYNDSQHGPLLVVLCDAEDDVFKVLEGTYAVIGSVRETFVRQMLLALRQSPSARVRDLDVLDDAAFDFADGDGEKLWNAAR